MIFSLLKFWDMKMFIFCVFLFFTGVCSGQIIAFKTDLKDVKDDYVTVSSTLIADSKGAKFYWQGSWGIDTSGAFLISKSD